MFIATRPFGIHPSSVGAAFSDQRWTNRPISTARKYAAVRPPELF